MSKESILNSISSNKILLNDIIPESSPSYQFCHKRSEINDTKENGWTPIYRSIISNNMEALKDLLKLGGDPNIPNNLGETPLYLCVDINNIEALNILLNNDPKPNCNIQKRNGNTALHLSIKKRRLNFTKLLLENNADPNIPNKLYSQTPTHLAIINHLDEQILEQFKICNADIYNLKDKYEKTAYDYALENKDENYLQLIKKIFGDNIQRRLLYNNLSEDNNNTNKSINDNKSINNENIKDLKKSIEKKAQNALSNSNIRQILNDYKNLTYENINFNKDKNNKNNKDKDRDKDGDKEKIKEIIFSEVNKINISELSSNNNYSTPKEKINIFNIESNLNTNNYDNQISPLISNDSKEKDNNNINKKDNIYEANPLDMMNQIIKSNKLKNKEKIINNNSINDNNENELNDSLEFNEQEIQINNYNNKKDEEITDFGIKNNNEYKEKNRISYHNFKNKEKIETKLNLLNLSNNNKSNRNTINSNINNEINNNNIQNKKRKSLGSNYESSTNQNSTRGTCSANMANLQISNIINSLKNNDTKTNDFYLTEEKEKKIKINMNYRPYQKKTKSNTNYKIDDDNKYLSTEEEFNKENIINRNKNKNNKIIKCIDKKYNYNLGGTKKAEDNNIYSNSTFSKLRDWLISCDLISYYNLLKNNSLCNIEQFIKNIKQNKKISYKDIENLGIRKPGHIFRFLIKLEIDANIIDYDIHSKIINKFNSNMTTMGLTMSNNELRCCGMIITFDNKDYNNCNYNYTNNYSDIFHFLKYLDLMKFKENFIHNGFDQVDYIILQLFSEYKFDKTILKEFLHIYDGNDKKKVINKLYEEKKKIAKELGIYIDDNEKETILNTQINDSYDNQECFIF